MDINDYKGIYKYKLIFPTLLISCALLTTMNLWFRIPAYFTFCCYVAVFAFFKSVFWNFSYILAYIRCKKIIRKYKAIQMGAEEEKIAFYPQKPLMYSFVIPNYQEDMDVLQNTLNMLQEHPRAKEQYCILLAMQMKQQNAHLKASRLEQQYKNSFRFIHSSYHTLKEHQLPGKASNVSSCVESLGPVFENNNIETENMFFTIIDADTLVHKWYIEEVEEDILKQFDVRQRKIYCPTQLFFYNDQESHVFVRVMDNYHSYGHLGQLVNAYGMFMPLSNYTLSYNLIKRVGFWDTCADAIGEDFHMSAKAMMKTNGDIISKQIYVAMNQMNIQTGNGNMADIKARFWQGVRHLQGVATFAYVLKNFIEGKRNFKTIGLILYYIDFSIAGFFVPWALSNIIFQDIILAGFIEPPHHPFSIKFFIIGSMILNQIGMTIYASYKNMVIQQMYKKTNNNGFRTMMEMKLYLVPLNFIYIMPIMFVGAMRTILKGREYIKADKKINKTDQKVNKTDQKISKKQRALAASI